MVRSEGSKKAGHRWNGNGARCPVEILRLSDHGDPSKMVRRLGGRAAVGLSEKRWTTERRGRIDVTDRLAESMTGLFEDKVQSKRAGRPITNPRERDRSAKSLHICLPVPGRAENLEHRV